MFTGIIKEKGRLQRLEKRAGKHILTITASLADELTVGDSLSVNGCCLTVSTRRDSCLVVEATVPTLSSTTLKFLRTGEEVNLEPAVRANDFLGGHYVLGHVDAVGAIKTIQKKRDFSVFTVEIPRQFARYLIEKGSICIDGVSLTLYHIQGNTCIVNAVPFTLESTTLKDKRSSDKVNIEFDCLVKIVAGLMKKDTTHLRV